jgi:ribonuclease BN (tRNA processing enzyme)
MELTVLGKSPSWQDSGGACSGYLISEQGFMLMLDCGSGTFAKMREQIDYRDIDAVLISHMHPDHVLDLVPFASALSYSPRPQAAAPRRPELHLPSGGRSMIGQVTAALGLEGLIDLAFDVSEYAPADAVELGPLVARFCEVPHYMRTFAVDLTQADGRRLTFGADCGPNDDLPRFAAGAELLMLEGTEVKAGEDFRGHMTPREAGELGRRAGVGRLVVTHYSDEVDSDWVLSEACAGYGADVELARGGASYQV